MKVLDTNIAAYVVRIKGCQLVSGSEWFPATIRQQNKELK